MHKEYENMDEQREERLNLSGLLIEYEERKINSYVQVTERIQKLQSDIIKLFKIRSEKVRSLLWTIIPVLLDQKVLCKPVPKRDDWDANKR